MSFSVMLTDDAAGDLEVLYDYIGRHDAPGKAAYILEQMEKVITKLSELPQRGAHPQELLALGVAPRFGEWGSGGAGGSKPLVPTEDYEG